ncbi:ribonuclease HI family protein [Candidatus Gottesmanbacteria bacterium]|nr:ribonuclease HI family protein [Candidatus Gottesmanbacteria bacterium]
MILNIYTDGGARGNPGPAAIGVVVMDENGKKIKEMGKKIGETTNNVAEYMALIEALMWVNNNPISTNNPITQSTSKPKIIFYLDSTLVVNQLNGMFKVKNGNLRDLIVKIRQLEQSVGGNIIYTYIPREKNWHADKLVNQALDDI